MMAPEPPSDYVQRPAEFEELRRRLLDSHGDAVAITAALRGAGGYGKSTLARALAHCADIADAYFDGVLWAKLGEKPDLLSISSDLIEILSGERPSLQNITAATARLGEALGDRRILLVVDDAWNQQDLQPLLHGGPKTTRLITTRRDDILPIGTLRQSVDAMKGHEARTLLSVGLPHDQTARQGTQLADLAARVGEWPLLLKLVNGFLRDRVARKQLLAQAMVGVNQRLDEKGLTAFDAGNEIDRTKAVARTIGVSLDLLDDRRRVRFDELAVFYEDADIPIGIIARLWAETGGFSADDTEDFLCELYNLSLLLNLDLDQRTVRLHDAIRHFLQDKVDKHGLVGQHQRLLIALDAILATRNSDAMTLRYCYLSLPHHLAEAEARERLDALLVDPGWLTAKLTVTANPQALVADYERFGKSETHRLISRTLRLTAGICARDPRQLIPQLLGRLMSREDTEIVGLLDAAPHEIPLPALLTESSSLTPPGIESAQTRRACRHGLHSVYAA